MANDEPIRMARETTGTGLTIVRRSGASAPGGGGVCGLRARSLLRAFWTPSLLIRNVIDLSIPGLSPRMRDPLPNTSG
jgi:hypothetical protein